nr:hypothetical protein [uncultured Oscillibacter sp.]
MADKRRLNLSFSMATPFQREAWKRLCAIPSGQRTDALCRMICKGHRRDRLLEEIRAVIREELRDVEFISAQEKTEQPQAGDVDESVLGFLLALQNDGGDE